MIIGETRIILLGIYLYLCALDVTWYREALLQVAQPIILYRNI